MGAVVKSIHVYPVKSCRGYELNEAAVLDRGLEHDRSWLLVSKSGLALTQRDFPRMALIAAQMLDDVTLKLSAAGVQDLLVKRRLHGDESTVQVWNDACAGVDQGDEVAGWFSSYLSTECRLVSMPEQFVRAVDPKYATGEQQVGFADGFPFLILSQESLDDLNSKLEYPVPMNRFRPNIVVEGCEPFAEDGWRKIRINGIEFDVVKPCARCVIVTIDQDDAVTGKEPLRTLSAYRQVGQKVMFGQNLVHHSRGRIRVGDLIEPV